MSGYIRQDTLNQINNGNVVEAVTLDAEFDALVGAFSSSSGHKHDGTIGEGGLITVLGPSQDLVVTAATLTPKTDNFLSLGTAALEFKDLYIDGTANIDMLIADAGTLAGANIVNVSGVQTLTNKTIDLTNNTLVATSAQLAAAITDETGTGSVVFSDSPALTGTPTAPTAAPATNTTQVATTEHVFAERSNTATLTNKTIDLTNNTLVATSLQLRAAVTDETGAGALVFANNPALVGTPTAPTAPANTNTTQIATTEHVFAERTNSATLTNKTLTSPVINTPTITGGTITGITDLAIAEGGTGASTAAAARTNLGVAIGTDVQAYDAGLDSIAALTPLSNSYLYTTGINTYATDTITAFGRSLLDDAGAAAAQATLGLGTMATQDAGAVNILGGTIVGITDLAVAHGGTGASTTANARVNLGLEIGVDVQQFDPDLEAIRLLTGTGIPARTTANTWALRNIAAGTGITVTNPAGVAGDPTINVSGLTTAEIAAATLVTSTDTVASNDNNTTLPTCAAVIDYTQSGPWAWTSTDQTITNGSVVTVPHGRGVKPSETVVVLKCTTAQTPYSVGDEVDITHFSGGGTTYGTNFSVDATNVKIRTGNGGVYVMDDSGAHILITNSSWKYVAKVRA